MSIESQPFQFKVWVALVLVFSGMLCHAGGVPDSFVWPTVGAALKQGPYCSDCYAFATARVLQDRYNHQHGTDLQFSPEHIASCSESYVATVSLSTGQTIQPHNHGCSGGLAITSFDWLHTPAILNPEHVYVTTCTGSTCEAGCNPYHDNLGSQAHGETYPCQVTCQDLQTPQRFYATNASCLVFSPNVSPKSWSAGVFKQFEGWSEATTATLIQKHILENGPVSAGFYVFRDFVQWLRSAASGSSSAVWTASAENYETYLGGHSVAIVGWGVTSEGVPFWDCVNSWGTSVGFNGHFRIERGVNALGIESHVCSADPLNQDEFEKFVHSRADDNPSEPTEDHGHSGSDDAPSGDEAKSSVENVEDSAERESEEARKETSFDEGHGSSTTSSSSTWLDDDGKDRSVTTTTSSSSTWVDDREKEGDSSSSTTTTTSSSSTWLAKDGQDGTAFRRRLLEGDDDQEESSYFSAGSWVPSSTSGDLVDTAVADFHNHVQEKVVVKAVHSVETQVLSGYRVRIVGSAVSDADGAHRREIVLHSPADASALSGAAEFVVQSHTKVDDDTDDDDGGDPTHKDVNISAIVASVVGVCIAATVIGFWIRSVKESRRRRGLSADKENESRSIGNEYKTTEEQSALFEIGDGVYDATYMSNVRPNSSRNKNNGGALGTALTGLKVSDGYTRME